MEPWKLVLSEAAFQFFNSRQAAERRKILGALEKLKGDPRGQQHFGIKDVTGRSLSILASSPFLITYWLDESVLEIRIVDIQRVRR
jgi:hypothetical protein